MIGQAAFRWDGEIERYLARALRLAHTKLELWEARMPGRISYKVVQETACAGRYRVSAAVPAESGELGLSFHFDAPGDTAYKPSIHDLVIVLETEPGGRDTIWESEGDPWEREDELKALLQKVPDAYGDFVLGVALHARREGIVSEVCDYIKAHPQAKTDEILEFEIPLSTPQNIIVDRGSGPMAAWSAKFGNLPSAP